MKEKLSDPKTKFFLLIILVILLIVVAMIVFLGGSGSVTDALMVEKAKLYAESYPGVLPDEEYESKKIMLSTLVSSGLINSKLSGSDCASFVYVTKVNGDYVYSAVNKCTTDGTILTKLSSKITKNTVTSGEGLYNTSSGYVFKGKDPNNYVKFGNSLWRIMSIDDDGVIKMIYADISLQESFVAWDDRYNADFPYSSSTIDSGINTYDTSNLKRYLDSAFVKYSEKFTGARIARLTKHTACTGKVVIGAGSNICSTKVETYASIITITDYMKASLDPNCSSTNSKWCKNDNFLDEINENCWTANADGSNTYSAFIIDATEGITSVWAKIPHCTKLIVTLNKDVTYSSGNGTKDNPYQFG